MSDQVIRFAVGHPDGPRSTTWSVVAKPSGDVYVAARSNMGVLKISLHASGRWRLAYTEQSGMEHADGDRVVQRWEETEEIAEGWRRGVHISVPTSSLRGSFTEKRAEGGIRWLPSPGEGRELRIDVLLRSASAGALTVNDAEEVGRIELSGGRGVWVTATDSPTSDAREDSLQALRAVVRERGGWPELAPAACSWGHLDDDGTPSVIDLGDPRTF